MRKIKALQAFVSYLSKNISVCKYIRVGKTGSLGPWLKVIGYCRVISLGIPNKGPFNNYVDKMREGEGGQKMSVFVYAQGIKRGEGN